jgi:hypothetical protein
LLGSVVGGLHQFCLKVTFSGLTAVHDVRYFRRDKIFFSYDLVDGWEAIEMNAQSDGF